MVAVSVVLQDELLHWQLTDNNDTHTQDISVQIIYN